jgi:lambda repressor-like predicted transcriptional regulator
MRHGRPFFVSNREYGILGRDVGNTLLCLPQIPKGKSMSMKKVIERMLERKGLNLNQLSKLSGVPKSTIYSWGDQKAVNLDQFKAVANALEVSVYQLAYGESDPFEKISGEVLTELFSGDVRVTIQKIENRKKAK